MVDKIIPGCFKTKQYNKRSGICMRCIHFKKCGDEVEEIMNYISDVSELENNFKNEKGGIKWAEK